MNEEKFFEIQQQARQNQSEIQDFLKDLDSWTSDIKQKEAQLKNQPAENSKATELPPVRNSLEKKRKKKRVKKKADTDQPQDGTKRISGYDFRAWDKFDVDAACKAVDEATESSPSEYETDEEWEVQRKLQKAVFYKDEGNQYFKDGQYDKAIECYTQGIDCDANNAILPANRAMALIKQGKYAAAELDCTASLALDSSYVKALCRRGTARIHLKKLKDAKEDFTQVLLLDASNKQAKAELSKIEKLQQQELGNIKAGDEGIVKAIYKAPEKRSKKPLRRVPIEEIGLPEDTNYQRMKEANKSLITPETDSKFEQFLTPGDISQMAKPKVTKDGMDSVSMAEKDTGKSLKKVESIPSAKAPSVKNEAIESRIPSSVPPVPKNSFQLQADCKSLRSSSERFYAYLKQIPPDDFPKLFGESLDSEVLVQVISVLKLFYICNGDPVYPVLWNLSRVKRFEMTAMFLSSKDKQTVKDLISHLQQEGTSKADLDRLRTAYGV